MMILTTYEHDEEYNEWESYKIEVNGKSRVDIGRIEPEDATLTRDLSFAYDIVPLMKEAYEAGKRGEDFTVAGITDNG